jgi:hypothetical protein
MDTLMVIHTLVCDFLCCPMDVLHGLWTKGFHNLLLHIQDKYIMDARRVHFSFCHIVSNTFMLVVLFSGNILLLREDDGSPSIGLIDYGQVKKLSKETRHLFAKLLIALDDENKEAVVQLMQEAGMRTKRMDPEVLYSYAKVSYDEINDKILEGGGDGTTKFILSQFSSKRAKEKSQLARWLFLPSIIKLKLIQDKSQIVQALIIPAKVCRLTTTLTSLEDVTIWRMKMKNLKTP